MRQNIFWKKVVYVLMFASLLFLMLILFHLLNTKYPSNIIKRSLNGLSLILTPALIALFLTYLLEPVTNYLIRKLKFSRFWAIVSTIIIFIGIIGGFLVYLVFFIIHQGKILYEKIISSSFIENVFNWLSENGYGNFTDNIQDYINNLDISSVIGIANNAVVTIISFSAILIMVPIFLWYFLDRKDSIFKSIGRVMPEKWQPHLNEIGTKSDDVIKAYFRSKILSMIFLFIMFICLFIAFGIQIEYVIMFAALITFLDLIPYIGPFIGTAIPIIYIFASNGTDFFYQSSLHLKAIYANIFLLGLSLLIQTVQGNIIIPKIAGKEMKIDSLLILVSMLFFGSVLGIWGIVLAIPLCGIIIVVSRYIKQCNNLGNQVADTEKSEAETDE